MNASRLETAAGRAGGQRGEGEEPVPFPHGLGPMREGPYEVHFARTRREVEEVQALRFEVFNRELGEGFAESWETGRDEDAFDRCCHHLVLRVAETGRAVGTYRMQTPQMAREGIGFYCAQEFDLDMMPAEEVDSCIELGRACILSEHRNGMALFALWRGIAAYLMWAGGQKLFGCCSLTSTDPVEGHRMLNRLHAAGHVSDVFMVEPLPANACPEPSEDVGSDIDIPRLFSTYLRYGAKVHSPPALDRAFGTIDFFIIVDIGRLSGRLYRMFFADLPGSQEPAG